MKKFTVCIPLIATAFFTTEAETEDEAFEKAKEAYDNGEIDLNGYDNEPDICWWVEEDRQSSFLLYQIIRKLAAANCQNI